MNASEIEYKNGWYDEEKDESGSFRWMGKTAFALLKDCSVPGRKHIRFIAGHTFPTKKSPILSVFVNDRLAMEREIDDTFSPYFFSFEDTGDITFEFRLKSVFTIHEDARDLGIIVRKIELLSPQEKSIIYGEGWHLWESEHIPFRWMSRRAMLLIPTQTLKKNKYLSLYAYSHYSNFDQKLYIDCEGKKIHEIPLLKAWCYYSISLQSIEKEVKLGNLDEDGFRQLNFSLNKISPEKFYKRDPRELGISIRNINFHDDDENHEDFLFFHNNALLNNREMLEGKTRLDSYPRNLGIDIYGRCNIKPPCVYCEWDWMKKVEGEDTFSIVDEKTLKEYGPFFRSARSLINCSIGEPLIHPRLKQILELCEKHKKVFEMATNGQALNEHTISAMVGKRIDLYVSLDAACKETYSKIRNDRWDSIIPNLILLNKERKKAGNLPRIFMIFIPMRVNENDLENFFCLCQKIEADQLILRPLNFLYDTEFEVERGGYCFNYGRELLSRDEMEEIFGKCEQYSKKYNVTVGNQLNFGTDQEL